MWLLSQICICGLYLTYTPSEWDKYLKVNYWRGVGIIKNGTCNVVNRKTSKLKLIKNYSGDLLHGEYLYYWDNGNIRFRGKYEYSQRVGIWRSFSKSGEIILEEIFKSSKILPIPVKISYSQLEKQLVGSELSHS